MIRLIALLFALIFSSSIATAQDNSTILQAFYWYIPDPDSTRNAIDESNLWKYISTKMANRFKEDGFSHIWLPPTGKAFSPDKKYNVGYAIYDHYDLGEFDQMGRVRTKYGTKQDLLQAVDTLHKNGLKVIADIVMNHIMGAESPENINYSYSFQVGQNNHVKMNRDGIVNAFLYFDFDKKDDYLPRREVYSNFKWKAEHFDGLESYGTYYLFKGKTPDKVSNLEDLSSDSNIDIQAYQKIRSDIILGNDFDFENKDVQDEMIRWTKWLIKEVGFDGLRVDAIKHIHIPFLVRWSREIKTYLLELKPLSYPTIFGEFWDGWAERLNTYLMGNPNSMITKYKEGTAPKNYAGINQSMDLFDVPLHYDFQKIAKENSSYPPTRMYNLPDRGLLALNPNQTVTFVDNHDTVPGQKLSSYIPLHTKIQAYTFILLHQYGTPTVFYRDIYKGNYISPYKNDNYNYLNSNIKRLVNIRNKYAYGKGEFFRNTNKAGILGYKRSGNTSHPNSGLVYLIRENNCFDNGLKIPTDGNKWRLIMGDGNIDNGVFYLNNNSNFAIWVKEQNK